MPPREEGVFKHPRLTVTSANRGPQANPIREETTQGASSRPAEAAWQAQQRRRRPQGLPDPLTQPPTTRMGPQATGWQAPRRSRRPQGLPDPPAWPLQNRFAGLPEETVEGSAYSQEYPKLPSQSQKTPVVCKTKRRPVVRTQEVFPPETDRPRSTQPYGSSYFLPGKISGKAATFLLDTGCTTNLLSRRLFDTLGAQERASLEPYEGAHGTLADGSCIPFYGIITLPG